MALYRTIQTAFWSDAKVADEFTPEDKFFYLYLFTNPHTNLCGCYEISKKQVSWETGYSIDTIDRLLNRFETIHKVIVFSEQTKEILIINWHKYNWTKSADFRKAIAKEIKEIKNADFKQYLSDLLEGVETVFPPSHDGGGTTNTNTLSNTITNTNTDKENDNVFFKKATRKKFVPPTIEEVNAYCRERNNSVDAETFVAFYSSKGWKVGRETMKDWKAAVITWEKRERKESKSFNVATEDATNKASLEKLQALEDFYLNGGST